jgi:DNA-binding CsgD family transcriptional regulator/tetratricopeptide (TPR) repeat protein
LMLVPLAWRRWAAVPTADVRWRKGAMTAPTERATDAFVGRQVELDMLRGELDQVRAGSPRVLLIDGPAGIGKTALVDRFVQSHDDLQVLRASGEPWEALVAYGVVDQLIRGTGVSRARIFAGRERALPVDEPISVGEVLLDLLGKLDGKRPVIIVVDDAQWADLDSLRALLFALRRLVADRVFAMLTVRSEDVARLPEGLRRLAVGQTGSTLRLGPIDAGQVRALARSRGLRDFSYHTAERLQTHTQGNPLYVRALLSEVPADRWRDWHPVLPAPRGFAALVVRRLESCGQDAKQLVEAAAVLGGGAPLATAVALGQVDDTMPALEEAIVVGLLQYRDEPGMWDLAFPHPLVQAAVYGQINPLQRARLHERAAGLLEDEGAILRHRVAAAGTADPRLAEDLEAFGRREAHRGAWASAASALVEASRLSPVRTQREARLLQAVDAMVGAGDLGQASTYAREIMGFPAGALRDTALGYLAVVRGRSSEAENLLYRAWQRVDATIESSVAATIAQRLALHAVGRLNGADVVQWAGRAVELTAPGESGRAEAQAVLGLGVAWQGRLAEGLAVHREALAEIEAPDESSLPPRIRMAHGWLLLVDGDIVGARADLMETAPAALARGSVRIALWAYAWLAITDYAIGSWDEAVLNAERAVALLGESGHAWLRPLVRWAAAVVPAARGDWPTADEHVRLGVAQTGDYELMIIGAALARAHVAAARGDVDAVLRSLAPLVEMQSNEVIDEPGFWPWRDLYGDALVNAGLLDEADAFLAPREALASERGRNVEVARLARVRGRLESARGNTTEAEVGFQLGLSQLGQRPLPFERALIELAYGQDLRRHGKRRAAAVLLQAAADRFATLEARPYLERCERELIACGLAPAERRTFDSTRLTPQELAVARLVADGLSNRQVAAELFVSIKTVQFHLTHIYSKLRISSRAELAARLRDDGTDTKDHPA